MADRLFRQTDGEICVCMCRLCEGRQRLDSSPEWGVALWEAGRVVTVGERRARARPPQPMLHLRTQRGWPDWSRPGRDVHSSLTSLSDQGAVDDKRHVAMEDTCRSSFRRFLDQGFGGATDIGAGLLEGRPGPDDSVARSQFTGGMPRSGLTCRDPRCPVLHLAGCIQRDSANARTLWQ